MAKGLVFAMENDDVSQVAGTDEGVAQAMAEATDAAQEVATEAQEIAQAADDTVAAAADAETLEKVQDVVAQTVQSGQGMDETTAQVAQVVVESICNRLGIPHAHRLMPATESFGSSNTRLAATKVALENGFTDTIKRIWEAIKKFVKNTWTKIKDFFARFFANADKVKKAAEAIKEKASKLNGKKKSKDEFESRSIYNSFNINNKTGKEVTLDVLKNHAELTGSVVVGSKNAQMVFDQLAISIQGKNTTDADVVSKAAADFVHTVIGTGTSPSYVKDNKASSDNKEVEVASIGNYIDGNKINFVKTTRNRGKADEAYSVTVEYSSRPNENDKNKTVKTLSVTDIQEICDSVIGLMDHTIEFGKKKSEIEKVSSGLMKVVDSALTQKEILTDKGNYNQKDHNNLIRDVFNSLNASLTRIYTQTPAWNVKAGKAALSFCTQSMGQYKDA